MRDIFSELDSQNGKNPERAAQKAMRPQLPKRFYKSVDVKEEEGGFAVRLDGRAVRTPAKSLLVLPTQAAAEIVAAEWAAQEKEIDPATMPATRIANTAIDGITGNEQAVLEDVLKFASGDLLFYRAGHPQELVARQQEHWDPILDWMATETGARFETGEGIMHIEQPREAIGLFGARLAKHSDALRLACLHTFTTLTGSALIALALAEMTLTLEEAWAAAHVDEDWNISLWGEDHEAAKRRELRLAEMKAAHDLFTRV
jgi:chaperone required for assembly of F1-ATPase